ncbi:PQQ-binding-like beta-propeller repeat protein [Cohnella caldifontis]|uniref:outer membrane protein assembly factor BamB family protein n=1 Tax=Cohnella caldifontis TaxID=3027471 RepID=UPI0023ECE862|nr:PQQ-binding-like beta-propeller repeat protein [Cohnella sp. YIM B05605]
MGGKSKIAAFGMTLAFAAALAGCSAGDSRAGGSPAVNFRGDARHTGVYATNGPARFSHIKWSFATGGRIRSSPVYDNGTIFVGSDDNHLYAADAETGKLKWKFGTGGPVSSSPVVRDGVVYFLSGDGNFYAVNAATGKQRWKFVAGGTNGPRDVYDFWLSSSAIDGDTVYFGGGGGTFYALDLANGKLRWKRELHFQNPDTYKDYPVTLHSTPVVDDGVVYVGTQGIIEKLRTEPGNIVALDAKTGEQLWASPLMQAADPSPALDDNAVYAAGRNFPLVALDRKTGKILWYSTGLQYTMSSPAVLNDTVYIGSSDQHELFAVSTKDGAVKWKYEALAAIHSSPVTDGKRIYFGSGDSYRDDNGYVYALDAKTGEEVSKLQVGGNVFSTPTLHEGVLYVGSEDHNLYAVN